MNPEAEQFLFRYKPGMLQRMSDYRIVWLMSFIHKYDSRVVKRSKSIAYLLMDLPEHLFTYVYHEYHYELTSFFEMDIVRVRVQHIEKNERSRSLASYLKNKKYVHGVTDIGNNTLIISFEKGSLKYNNQTDALIVIENGTIRTVELPPLSRFDESVNASYLKKGKCRLHSDLLEYELHNKLRLELVK